MDYLKLESINSGTIVEKYSILHYPEFHTYITNHYPTDIKWTEKLYWYYHNIDDYPKCPYCGKRVKFVNFIKGYKKFCSDKCAHKSGYIKETREKTLIEKYGVKNSFQLKETLDKRKQTWLDKYGVDNPFASQKIKDKIKQTWIEKSGVEYGVQSDEFKEKRKQTLIDKYGTDVPCRNVIIMNKYKQTNLKKYGVEIPSKNPEIQYKRYLTQKRNNSFNSSKIEQQFKQWLDDSGINYIKEYRSDKYPFKCDFYFPDKDLYLEIQGTWTHGGHPFDPANEEDIKIAKSWLNKHTDYYNIAHRVWTVDDPIKRETAKKNKLNWCEVFSNKLDDVIKIFKKEISQDSFFLSTHCLQ